MGCQCRRSVRSRHRRAIKQRQALEQHQGCVGFEERPAHEGIEAGIEDQSLERIGVAVIVFMSALLSGLQANLIKRTLSSQAHITLLPPEEIARAAAAGVRALKLYPAGATTNSDAGVTDIRKTYRTLEAMQKHGMLLLVHGEVTSSDIDLFDREAVFIDQQMIPLRRDFPELKVVFEHITTREAAQYVAEAGAFTAATITAHHLLYNRNAIFTGGIRPHYYCLPVLKRETHRLALVKAATGGHPRFFLGTDSAPHARHTKETSCGCAGLFNAPFAIEAYAQAFDEDGALDRLEAFASLNGPAGARGGLQWWEHQGTATLSTFTGNSTLELFANATFNGVVTTGNLQAFSAYTVSDGSGVGTDVTFTNVNGGTAYGLNASAVAGVFSTAPTYRVTADTAALSNPGLNFRVRL